MYHVKFAALAAVIAFCAGVAIVLVGALSVYMMIVVFDAWGPVAGIAIGFGLILAVSAFITYLITPWSEGD